MCRYNTIITPTSNFPSQHKQRQDRIQRFFDYPNGFCCGASPGHWIFGSSVVPPCFGVRHGSESCRGRSKAEHVAESLMPIDDHLILDCFEDIPKDFAGESHHFSLDQIFNDLDRCFFVWWNLKIGTFIFLVVVRSSEGANLPKPDIVWYLCLRVWLIIMYSTTLYKYIYLYIYTVGGLWEWEFPS